jgi:hypothetical protein
LSIAHLLGDCPNFLKRYAGTQAVHSPRYITQLFIGCRHLLIRI